MNRLRALISALVLALCAGAPLAAHAQPASPVTVVDNGDSWTLDNGIVKATIRKNNAFMSSLIYKGKELMGGNGGTWNHTPQGAPILTNVLVVDPKSNGGERVEVMVKGITNGTYTLTPGAAGGGAQADLEIHYVLGRGDSGIYVYGVWDKPAAYPAGGTGPEDRYITRLSQDFDWITVDKDRNMLEAAPLDWGKGVVVHAKEQRIMAQGVYKNSVEHKYSYSGSQYLNRAYGWSSTKDKIGIWFINATAEHIAGGPRRIDLDAHFGDNGNPEPIILSYWHSGHYFGNTTPLTQGEAWHKVIGPIFIYANALDKPVATTQKELDTLAATAGNPTVPASWTANANALWQDALNQAKKENAKWPYAWVNEATYTPAAERATVTGRIVLDDPLAKSKSLPNLSVGLVDMRAGVAAPGGRPFRDAGDDTWMADARYYNFFTDGSADGRFNIAKVRPGKYRLVAHADGVLGDYVQTDITVEPGKALNLGDLHWKPVRFGRQVWEIGTPDRTAREFLKGDGQNYWLWGWNLRYALLFPKGLTYTVGKSTPAKDWFFEQVPTATNLSFVNPDAKDPANQRFGWVKAESLEQYPQTDQSGPWKVYGRGGETVWTIKFNMPKAARGQGALRLGIAGVDGLRAGLPVTLNGQSVGAVGDNSNPDNKPLIQTNAIRYNTDQGYWQQRTVKFDASLLKAGENTLTFTVPAGDLQSGIVWDYLRLELDENAAL
jgi:rhamnogalacturonan endolyase